MKKKRLNTIILVTVILMMTITPMVNAEESTKLPNNMKIRKVTTDNGQLYVWVYLNTNIKTEIRHYDDEIQTLYVYDSQQIKIPLESNKLTLQEIESLADSTYTQQTIRQRLTNNLKDSNFTTDLIQAITSETKEIDQREREFTINNAKVADIKSIIGLEIFLNNK